MDDLSVMWSKERYEEVKDKLSPFLKQCGYNVKRDVTFAPVSGLMGYGIKVTRLYVILCHLRSSAMSPSRPSPGSWARGSRKVARYVGLLSLPKPPPPP
eukprot:9495726-Pyramimonas_sp.AAC.1